MNKDGTFRDPQNLTARFKKGTDAQV